MKVLQVVSSPQRRGAEVFALQLGEVLERQGHHVSTVALAPSDDRAQLPFEVLEHPRHHPKGVASLVGHLRRHDVAVAHGGSTLGPVALAATLARRPFVYRNIGDPQFWGDVRAADLRIGLPLRRAASTVALYPAARDYMIERYRLDPRRVSVASNAVDADRFPRRTAATRAAARSTLGIAQDATVLGYLGALSPEKRPEWAFDVATDLGDVVLLVAGDGPLRDSLTARAEVRSRRDGPRPDVRLLGAVADPAAFLAAVDVLLLPSRTEGVPGALIEATLTGVPVAATAVGGVSDVIAATGGGIACDDDLAAFAATVRSILGAPDDFVAPVDTVRAQHDVGQVALVWERVLADVVSQGRR